MGIKVTWHGREKTSIYFEFTGKWDWSDFDRAIESMRGLSKSASQPLPLIWDLTTMESLPNGAVIYWRSLLDKLSDKVNFVVLVCPNALIRTAANMLQRMNTNLKIQIIIASTLDLALQILELQDPARNIILVIDDEQDLLQEVVSVLQFEGYKVSGASNGVEGVNKAKALPPNLIICDISMPSMDGYEVLTAVRQNEKTASVPFIFLTAMADRKFVRQGMDMGADDYMTKPFENDELVNAVKSRLARQATIRLGG